VHVERMGDVSFGRDIRR